MCKVMDYKRWLSKAQEQHEAKVVASREAKAALVSKSKRLRIGCCAALSTPSSLAAPPLSAGPFLSQHPRRVTRTRASREPC